MVSRIESFLLHHWNTIMLVFRWITTGIAVFALIRSITLIATGKAFLIDYVFLLLAIVFLIFVFRFGGSFLNLKYFLKANGLFVF